MADERCVFPGDNPRPGRWLGRDAAERLLSGEPLESLDAEARIQADRLAGVLAALAVEPAPDAELPGEANALAAFRKERADGNGEVARPVAQGRTRPAARTVRITTAHPTDAGLVRLGRPDATGRRARWGRPTRLGLAVALTAGMIGGVAAAVGTGILRTPFGDDRPGPAASVTAAATPEQPPVPPSPGTAGGDGSQPETPDGATGGPTVGGSSKNEAGGATASGQQGSDVTGESGRTDEWWSKIRSSCRDLLDGKELNADSMRDLQDAAGGGGTSRLTTYCNGLLDGNGTGDGSSSNNNSSSGSGSRKDSGDGDKDGGGDRNKDRNKGGDKHKGESEESGEDSGAGTGSKKSGGQGSREGSVRGAGSEGDVHILPLLPLQPGDDQGRNGGTGGISTGGIGTGDPVAGSPGNDVLGNDVLGNTGILTPPPSSPPPAAVPSTLLGS